MRRIERTKTFKKCLKKYRHQKDVIDELKKVLALLTTDKKIPIKYRDHELKGKFVGIRELHLKPDTLLLYVKIEDERLILMALGSHSDVFS